MHSDKPYVEAYYRKTYDNKHPLLALLTLLVAAACESGAAATASPTTVNFAMAAQNGSAVSGTGRVVESSVRLPSR